VEHVVTEGPAICEEQRYFTLIREIKHEKMFKVWECINIFIRFKEMKLPNLPGSCSGERKFK
jgi:hypothetical protein